MSENTTLGDKLASVFGDALLSTTTDYDFQVFEFHKSALRNVVIHLKEQEGFNYLTTLCGSHFPDAEKEREFCMMYQLHNFSSNERIRLKTFMSREDLMLETICDVYDAANWMEREAYDFFGFTFSGHPNMKRILNMEEMNYFPLRKEYPLEDMSRDDKDDTFFGR